MRRGKRHGEISHVCGLVYIVRTLNSLGLSKIWATLYLFLVQLPQVIVHAAGQPLT